MRFVVTFELVSDEMNDGKDLFEAIAMTEADVVLDLQHVTRMDGSGLDALKSLIERKMESGFSIQLARVRGQPREFLREQNALEIG